MKRQRPVAVTVVAILGLVFGGLQLLGGLCCEGSSLVGGMLGLSAESSSQFGPGHPAQFFRRMDAHVAGFTAVVVLSLLFGLLLAVLLLASSVGLLLMRSWARWTALAYALLAVLCQCGYTGYYIGLARPAAEDIRMNSQTTDMPIGYFGSEPTFQAVAAVLVTLATLAFAVALVIGVLLPGVRAAFDPQPAGAGTTGRQRRRR